MAMREQEDEGVFPTDETLELFWRAIPNRTLVSPVELEKINDEAARMDFYRSLYELLAAGLVRVKVVDGEVGYTRKR